ncbi:winged helix-turn-helix transcriptional regulator [Streptomyces sp. AK02-01A]|uniref:winged helix-turn-helix transcriptional regulator n=1 Tax=Streptomyces sp. AK02-01A TaxID=3028648 RepID=UPI0029BD50D0|nr:winged helix-turn-helix transcriptional regulator [Streptomyces sp. AK02-01A]MDX3854907.1 winged helix-turn-helix transcriptional regulator [Streptomyces sp. AK02-01A]
MSTTPVPRTTLADLQRVAESLEMISTRWRVWVLMTLSEKPLRYTEIKSKLPWLHDGSLAPKLRKLSESGLVERTEYEARHVTYGLTARGTELMPVLKVIAAWGDACLVKDTVLNPLTGRREPERIASAQNVEDALLLLTPRHTTAILWTLRMRGVTSIAALESVVMPSHALNAIYPPLRRLVKDGLVERDGEHCVQLSATGLALAPVYRSVSAWAAGRPLSRAGTHPVWGDPTPSSQTGPGTRASTQARIPASAPPGVRAPAVPARAPKAAWQPGDLFSAPMPARPAVFSPAGGQRR